MKSLLAKPAVHIRIKKLPLVLGCVPIEGIEPPPPPVSMQGNGENNVAQASEFRDAVQIIERDRDGAEIEYHLQRKTSRNDPDHVGKMVADSVAVIQVNGETAVGFDHFGGLVESGLCIWGMVQHANGINEIEAFLAKRHREEIRLNDVDMVSSTDVVVGGVHRRREIDAEDLSAFVCDDFRE